jgi:hypothetical protein
MSKMNALSIDAQESAYEQYIESQREELRQEGAEELRVDILRSLEVLVSKSWTSQEKLAYQTAVLVVEQATR